MQRAIIDTGVQKFLCCLWCLLELEALVQWVCANHWAPVFEETISSCYHIWLNLTALLWELTEDKIHTQWRMTIHDPHGILLNGCPRRGEWLLTCRLLPLRPPDLNLGNHYLWGGPKQLHLSVYVLSFIMYIVTYNRLLSWQSLRSTESLILWHVTLSVTCAESFSAKWGLVYHMVSHLLLAVW
jgi:hypothetical protein